jgi:hypothetical protein
MNLTMTNDGNFSFLTQHLSQLDVQISSFKSTSNNYIVISKKNLPISKPKHIDIGGFSIKR